MTNITTNNIHDQTYMNQYFRQEWKSDIENYSYSGIALVEKVSPDEWVLDVGCGDNFFKGKIKNLIGIDPANEAADMPVNLENFEADIKFDVAFCLGSINFGNEDYVKSQIAKLLTHLTPDARIYWRSNPGVQDHVTEGCKQINFYPWSFDKHRELAEFFGYTAINVMWDIGNTRSGKRIYAEWVR